MIDGHNAIHNAMLSRNKAVSEVSLWHHIQYKDIYTTPAIIEKSW